MGANRLRCRRVSIPTPGYIAGRDRSETPDRFRAGAFPYLVATDIAARGIDVTSISHVINFDMPDTADAYIHRIGRTGRAERSGDAFTLVTPDDTDMVRSLEKIMSEPLPRQTLSDFDYRAPAPVYAQQESHRTPTAARPVRRGARY